MSTSESPSVQRTSLSIGYWLIASLGLVWNIFGIVQFLGSTGRSVERMLADGFTPAQAETYAALPLWMNIVFAIGVFGGALGCALALVRSRWAVAVFTLSLCGYIVLYIGDIALGVFAALGTSQIIVLTCVVAIAAALWVWSRRQRALGRLS